MRHFLALLFCCGIPLASAADNLFARENLVAWCIVPFDAKKRGPEERAEMLKRLGIRRLAYDYRAEHVPTFDAEMEALKRHQIELTAWWFPGSLNDETRQILEVIKRHNVHPQLWITGGGSAPVNEAERKARVASEADRIGTIAKAAEPLRCKVALYNHGGWFGDPINQLAIIEFLAGKGVRNVGIVYNLHHGHDDLDRFKDLLETMKPHLLALNLNGMTRGGDKSGKKILVIGAGEEDGRLLKVIHESGWRGPVGILNHTEEDAETRLKANLVGLETLLRNTASEAQ